METKNLVLTNFNGRSFKLQTYFLKHNPKLKEQKKPLMIVIPGGSFDHLSLREGEPVALAYNSYGFNSVVMAYNLLQDPGTIYPDAALNVLRTVQYFRDHAADYHLDANKVVTMGFSAGGHVASAANALANSPVFAQKYGFDGGQVRPNKTILGYPLINIKHIGFTLPANAEGEIPKTKMLQDTALGVTAKTPATFIFQAWNDPIVLISNTLEYLNALNKAHVSCEAHLFATGGHGFSLARPSIVEAGRDWQDNPHDSKWFNLSIGWLRQQLRR